jgi:hypothetical protein
MIESTDEECLQKLRKLVKTVKENQISDADLLAELNLN